MQSAYFHSGANHGSKRLALPLGALFVCVILILADAVFCLAASAQSKEEF
jgi:hypothetical protein